MGPSMQWRAENTREPRSFGEEIRIGSGRHAATGYLGYSQRVGPGLVILAPVLDDEVRMLVEHCRDQGFTALAPHLEDPSGGSPQIAREAVQMLVANWHPRVGVLALPGAETLATAVAAAASLDALVLPQGARTPDTGPPRTPILVADTSTEAGLADALDFLAYHLS